MSILYVVIIHNKTRFIFSNKCFLDFKKYTLNLLVHNSINVFVLRYLWMLSSLFNIDMFEILQESRANIREIFMRKNSLFPMIENCLTWLKKKTKKAAGNGGFRRETAVFATVSYSSILFSTKTTSVPNFRAVTLLWTEIIRVVLLV